MRRRSNESALTGASASPEAGVRRAPSSSSASGLKCCAKAGLVPAANAPLDAKPHAEAHRQAGIPDRRNVLLAQQILSPGVDLEPGKQLIAAAEIEFGKAIVEIAVGKDQGVSLLQIFVAKEGGVVAAGRKRRGKHAGNFLACVARGEEAGMGWTAERTSACERRVNADRDAVECGRIPSQQSLVVAGERALND